MPDRWDEEDELERDRLRGRGRRESLRESEPEREPTIGELIEGSVRKLVTGLIIAGGLIGLGVYGSSRGGGSSAPDYQITTSADGHIVYRLDTDRGRIIACEGTHCWQVLQRGQDLDDEPPADNASAARPVQAQPAPAQVAPAQPAAQLPAPQNMAVPATR
jgi:hypothetical protein